MQTQQCVQLTRTNCPFGFNTALVIFPSTRPAPFPVRDHLFPRLARQPSGAPRGSEDNSWSVTMVRGTHPIPFRTRKLNLSTPMVLHGQPCGRVGLAGLTKQQGPPWRTSVAGVSRVFLFARSGRPPSDSASAAGRTHVRRRTIAVHDQPFVRGGARRAEKGGAVARAGAPEVLWRAPSFCFSLIGCAEPTLHGPALPHRRRTVSSA